MKWSLNRSFALGAALGAVIASTFFSPAYGQTFRRYAPPKAIYLLTVCDGAELLGSFGLQVPQTGQQIDPNGAMRKQLAQMVTRFPQRVVAQRLRGQGFKVEVFKIGGDCTPQ